MSGERAPVPDELWVTRAGTIGYEQAVELQERLRDLREAGEIPDVLVLLEHPAVYTKGRRTEVNELPLGDDWYRARGIEVLETDRGGRVTYHGPGQLVGYPIMRVPDVVGFVRTMECALVKALADEGVIAEARPKLTGVWTPEGAKIASIGIHVRRRFSTHGFAVNVDNDLTPFEWIVPCGIEGVRMTSVGVLSGRSNALPCFSKRVAWRFAQAHGLRQRLVSLPRLLGEDRETSAPVSSAVL
jgi:lipoyl(octanoyl) transferase